MLLHEAHSFFLSTVNMEWFFHVNQGLLSLLLCLSPEMQRGIGWSSNDLCWTQGTTE